MRFVFAWLVVIEAFAAAEPNRRRFDVPAGEAEAALRQFVAQADVELLYSIDTINGLRTNAVNGELSVREALLRLVAQTGLVIVDDDQTGALMLRRARPSPPVSKVTGLDPQNKTPSTMKKRSPVLIATAWIATLLATIGDAPGADAINTADRQSTAAVTGVIVDANTGKFLEGAEVSIVGTNLRTTSEREGRFTLDRVVAGPIGLMVRYPGLNEKNEQVTLTAGQTTSVVVRLTDSDVVKLEEFKVSSVKEGMAQAVAFQKAASNSTMIAASDQFGDMAEGGNAAEYLKFLPGIGVEYANNEARAVSLRGLSSSFTSVNFDNNPVASASSGSLNRTFEFEQVAVNNVETVEVFKTVLPDQPATSTGGAVNLVSKSAFDREGSQLTYRALVAATSGHLRLKKTPGWGQGRNTKLLPGVDLNYSTRLRENLGINLTLSDSQRYTDMERSEYIPEFNPANGALPDDPALSGWHLLNEQKVTNRRSVAGKLDWRPAPRTKVSVNAQWNWFDMLFSQRDLRVFTGTLAPLAIGDRPAYTGSVVPGRSGRGSVPLNQTQSWKHGMTYSAGAGVQHDFTSGGKLNLSYYWTQSYSKYRNASGGYYAGLNTNLTGVTVDLENVSENVPTFRVTDAAGAPVDINDLTKRTITNLSHNSRTGVDTRNGLSGDYLHDLKTRFAVKVKVGGRRDEVSRNIHNLFFGQSAFTPAITGGALAALADPIWNGRSIGFDVPGNTWPSIYRAYEKFGPMPSTPASDVLRRIDETTDSLFVRTDFKPLSKLLVVGGVRREMRESVSVDRGVGARGTFEHEGNFPSLNLKYSATQNLLLRFGAAKTIGLPNYGDLSPSNFTITEPNEETGGDGRITTYNPNLQPYEVNNYDLSLEYYFKHSGFLSASIFRKDFYNYIISATQELTPASAAVIGLDLATLPYPADRYNLTTRFNVKDPGHYEGIELAFAQTLSFLPRPLNTLGVQVNYTALKITGIKTGEVFDVADPALNASIHEQVGRALDLHAVKEQLNFVVSYRFRHWNVLLSTNYTGKVLRGLNRKTVRFTGTTANAYLNEQVYSAPRALVDLRVDYRLSTRFTPYVQIRNLLNRSSVYTTFDRLRSYTEYGDPMYEFGVRGVW